MKQGLLLSLLMLSSLGIQQAKAAMAAWFPDRPDVRDYNWSYQPCPGCKPLVSAPAWARMADLAGVAHIRFMAAPDEHNGQAYSAAPDVVVLSPSVLKLRPCQLAFVVGHEIAHIAQRHYNEDAEAVLVLSGKPSNWTRNGDEAMQLADGDFGLMMRLTRLWQDQEMEADWLGSLLAAQACGCNLKAGAMAYLSADDEGGGIGAAHPRNQDRIHHLIPFEESARRLIKVGYH